MAKDFREALNSTKNTKAMLKMMTTEIQRILEPTCEVTSVEDLWAGGGVKLLIGYPDSNTKLVQEALPKLVTEPTSVTVNGVTYTCTFHVVPTIPMFPYKTKVFTYGPQLEDGRLNRSEEEREMRIKELEESLGLVPIEMTEDEIFELSYW